MSSSRDPKSRRSSRGARPKVAGSPASSSSPPKKSTSVTLDSSVDPAVSDQSATIELGVGVEPIAGYMLERRLGQGGFGEVWSALAPGGFSIALKFIKTEKGKAAKELAALEAIREVRHPNLLDIQFVRRIGDYIVVGMPLCDRSLADRLNECVESGQIGVPAAELALYLSDAARAIDFLNERRHKIGVKTDVGIQHRDIKPHNIFLSGDSARVADFGLAKALDSTQGAHSGALTPYYAAPEMLRGKVSRTSDQYSLAITYCECRTGVLPFRGSIHDVVMGHIQGEPDFGRMPASEQAVVRRALAKNPAKRFDDCRTFIEMLHSSISEGEFPTEAIFSPPSNFDGDTDPHDSTFRGDSRWDSRPSAAMTVSTVSERTFGLMLAGIIVLSVCVACLAIVVFLSFGGRKEAEAKEPPSSTNGTGVKFRVEAEGEIQPPPLVDFERAPFPFPSPVQARPSEPAENEDGSEAQGNAPQPADPRPDGERPPHEEGHDHRPPRPEDDDGRPPFPRPPEDDNDRPPFPRPPRPEDDDDRPPFPPPHRPDFGPGLPPPPDGPPGGRGPRGGPPRPPGVGGGGRPGPRGGR